jgi:hypothetical protein
MFIIWGFRNVVATLATVFATCRACGNPAAQRLSLVKRKFTLFFIPLVTLKKTYVQTCAMCGTHRKLSETEAQQFQAGMAAAEQHEAAAGPVEPPASERGPQVSVTRNEKFVL